AVRIDDATRDAAEAEVALRVVGSWQDDGCDGVVGGQSGTHPAMDSGGTALSRQTEFTADMRDSRVDGCGDSRQQTPEAAVEYGPEIEIRGDQRRIRATRHGRLQQGLCRGDTQSLGDVMTVWRDRVRDDRPESADLRGCERGPCMVGHIGLQVREVAAGTRSLPIGGSRWFE